MQLTSLMKGFQKQRTAISSAFDALDQIRDQIAAKADEIEALRAAPRPVEAALAAFDAWCDQTATSAIDKLSLYHLLEPQNDGAIRLPVNRLPGEVTPDTTVSVQILLGLVILTAREKLRGVIEDQLADLTRDRETLTDPERAERIAQARADLRTLELTEEAVIRRMVDAGIAVQRRAAAPALALLAADASLPV